LDAEPLVRVRGGEVAARRTAAFDRAVRALVDPSAAGPSVAAIGGYGRREMTPGSDLDLLFVYEPGVEVEAATGAVLYALWDAGIRASHAVRTPAESHHECASNVQTLTSTLDARPLAGPVDRITAVRDDALALARADAGAFAAALRHSRAERADRFGRVGERLEPNVKEGIGGLRDVQVLRWMAEVGADDGLRVDPAWGDELLRVRAAMHRVAGPASEVLVADHHAETAAALGVTDEPGWEARDVLLRSVWSIGRAVAARCDERLGDGDGDDSAGPIGTLLDPSPPTWTPARRSSFLSMLGGSAPGRALRRLDAARALERLVPGWPDVRGRPQRDPYHRYPVDLHLIETAAAAARLLDGTDEPFAAEAAGLLGDVERRALVLGALLHDIGKVGRGSHVALGPGIASEALDGMGFDGEVRDDALFLVREHLLLSDTATRRNVGDEDVVTRVASRVGDARRLALLYLLTMADAEATGPAASTPWRMGLIRALVARVDALFSRGLMDTGRAAGLSRAEAAVRAALAGHPLSRVERFLEAVPTVYLATVPAADTANHVDLVLPPPGPGELRVHVGAPRLPGTATLSVALPDRTGALASVAGALTLAGLSIIAAQVFTTEGGTALDLFEVRGGFEPDISEERWGRFRSSLDGALAGSVDLAEELRRLRSQYRPPSAAVPVAVRVSGGLSDFFTVVEVEAADRLGLLFDLCRSFAELGVDVHSARVATYGPRVVDVFDVTDEGGVKVTDEGRVVALERALRAAAASES
jgi:[protein-PII] uridylyltransferase